MKKARIIAATCAIALMVLISGCSTVPVTGRSQLNIVSASQEMQLGLSGFEELKKETPIERDPQINAMVQRVGQQIARVTAKDMPDAQWEFVVFQSKEANAFCLPGGKVGIYTGILPITKNEAGMATVMAHEVAHAVAHHGAERMSEALLMEGGGQVLGAAVSAYNPTWSQAAVLAYGVGSKVGRELPHSRKQESEADHIGLIYMARAGYNPQEAVEFWKRFMEFNNASGGSSVPAFLRTHPLDTQRIQQLQNLMPEAQREFQRSTAK